MTTIPVSSAVAAAGVALLAGGIGWRWAHRHRSDRHLIELLNDPRPPVRQVAAGIAGQHGIRRHAATLIARAGVEDDALVRRTLAEAVARNQWEPLDTPDMVELRFWASSVLAAGQVATVDRADEGGDRWAPLRARRTPEPGAGLTVLVTGGGGPAGVAVLQELRRLGHRTVSADADPVSAGVHLADEAFLLPRAEAPTYLSRLVAESVRREVDVIVATVAEELLVLDDHADEVSANGLAVWGPTREAVEVCCDKWAFAQLACAHGDPVPATALGSVAGVWLQVPGPWIVKPRNGRGSRDVYPVDSPAELRWAIGRVPDALVQTRATGREFTVDVLMGDDATLVAAVPRWRLQTRGGISTRGETFSSAPLVEAVERLLGHVGLRGPANVQGFLDADEVTFIEVNPRFSGGLPLSLAAGADLIGEYIRRALGTEGDPALLAYRPGVRMTRWFAQSFDEASDAGGEPALLLAAAAPAAMAPVVAPAAHAPVALAQIASVNDAVVVA